MLAVVEIALCALAEGWMHFVTFERTSNDTFQQVTNYRVQSAPASALQQRAQSTKKSPFSSKHRRHHLVA
jgi:hypothetical protein